MVSLSVWQTTRAQECSFSSPGGLDLCAALTTLNIKFLFVHQYLYCWMIGRVVFRDCVWIG